VLHGCCLGVVCQPAWFTVNDATGGARWPAAQVELLFNVIALAVLGGMRWRKLMPGQLFHLYLMAYGAFRFGHEFWRETPQILGPISGYQLAALLLFGLGAVRFWQRRRMTNPDRPDQPCG
jgi:phosphatidylglycerol:prolipoprotein diacylglycerol transferase